MSSIDVALDNSAKRAVNKAKKPFLTRLREDIKRNWKLYLIYLPVFIYYLVFHYFPIYGVLIAFKNFNPRLGILKSEWVGLKYFIDFFTGTDFGRILFNTLKISFSGLIFVFPAPIILALLINEVKNQLWKRTIQTISYLPHFISLVVICGILRDFVAEDGIVTWLLSSIGLVPKADLLGIKRYFVPIYIISDIWQGIGWGSIIYLAALSGINQELYEAASIDGAGRWRQTFVVTIPGILPTIVVMLILRMGSILSVGFEKIILLYNPLTYETADVISSYTYRRGLMELNFSYSSAVGLSNSIVNFIMLISANYISKRINGSSIW